MVVKPTAFDAILTDKSPKALGAYSQAIKAGNTIYISGQLGLDPATGRFLGEGQSVESETKQALENLQNILAAAGCQCSNVVSTTILLENIEDFTTVNTIYSKYFPPLSVSNNVPPPARACYAVKALPKGAKVEISAVAYKSS